MSFTSLSIIILTVLALSVYVEVRKGYKKGLTKSLIHLAILLGCSLLSAVLSVALAAVITPVISESMQGSDIYLGIVSIFGDAPELFPMIMSMLFSLVLYLPVFFMLLGLVSLLTKIVCKCAFEYRESEMGEYLKEGEDFYLIKKRSLGAVVGAVSGFLVAIVLLMPLVESVKAYDEILEIVSDISGTQTEESAYSKEDKAENRIDDGSEDGAANSADNGTEESAENVSEDITKYANDFSATVVDVCGGRMLFDMTTRVSMYGRTTYLNKELEAIKGVDINEVKNVISAMGDVSKYDAEETEELLATVDKSLILKAIMLSSVRGASEAWLSGTSYMGVSRPVLAKNELIDRFFDEILYVFSTSDFDTIDADIMTVMNLNKIFYERRRVYNSDAYDDLIFDLEDNGTAVAIRLELEKNPHMRSVSYAIDDLIMTLLADELYDEMKYTSAARDELYSELADALNTSAGLSGSVRISAITERARECFADYGTYIPEALYDKLASALIGGVGTDEESVSYEDVKDFFEKQLSTYNESQEAPDVSGNADFAE